MKEYSWARAVLGKGNDVKAKHLVRILQKGLYVVIVATLCGYLYALGPAPWQHAFAHWRLFFQIMVISGLALLIQAQSFRVVQPFDTFRLDLMKMVGIWSFSAMVSVVAPIMAGIATRTTLLVQAGMPLTLCVAATLRQMWMGFEYALLIGGAAAFGWQHEKSIYAGCGMLFLGCLMLVIRVVRARLVWKVASIKWYTFLDFLQEEIPARAHFWFVAQIAAMSATYLLVFNGFGASFGFAEALLLSSVTVLASLLIIIPNGLGVVDALWVLIATNGGLDLGQSTALAIIMRLSNLCAATILTAWLSIGGVVMVPKADGER
jgi:uncharacterized membrane protein YbhN (UPF0104 family)